MVALIFSVAISFFLKPLTSSAFEQSWNLHVPHFSLQLRQEKNLQEISLSGSFEPGDFDKVLPLFGRLATLSPTLVLKLSFEGGDIDAIEAFARSLKRFCREHGCRLVTVIPAGAQCLSYCVPLFMVGETRAAIKGSQFGFHAATLPWPWDYLHSGWVMRGNYLQHGVARDWLMKHRHLFEETHYQWVRPEDLVESQLVTHVFANQGDFERFLP